MMHVFSQTGAPQGEESEEGCEETQGPKGCWRSVLEDSLCSLIPFSRWVQGRGCWVLMICVDYDLRFCCMLLCCHAEKKHLGPLWFTFRFS